jgi:uncharacterized protein (DUF2267 family)
MARKKDVETTVREIHRKTHKKYSAEEKIRIVLEGLRERARSLSCAAAKASIPTCITNSPRNSWEQANSVCSEIRSERQTTRKCSQCELRTNSSSSWQQG